MHSAVDVGCGVGTWLSVLRERGVDTVRGFDGAWVRADLPTIPRESFIAVDLTERIPKSDRFDLAISVEVAEHLRRLAAETFVDSLVDLSDFVLFSAAIPHQGGKHHLNERWQDYWAGLFWARGYAVSRSRSGRRSGRTTGFRFGTARTCSSLCEEGAARRAAGPHRGRFPLRIVHPAPILEENTRFRERRLEDAPPGVRAS